MNKTHNIITQILDTPHPSKRRHRFILASQFLLIAQASGVNIDKELRDSVIEGLHEEHSAYMKLYESTRNSQTLQTATLFRTMPLPVAAAMLTALGETIEPLPEDVSKLLDDHLVYCERFDWNVADWGMLHWMAKHLAPKTAKVHEQHTKMWNAYTAYSNKVISAIHMNAADAAEKIHAKYCRGGGQEVHIYTILHTLD